MSIDVVDLVGVQSRFLQGAPYGSYQPDSPWRRLGHMMRVNSCAVTN